MQKVVLCQNILHFIWHDYLHKLEYSQFGSHAFLMLNVLACLPTLRKRKCTWLYIDERMWCIHEEYTRNWSIVTRLWPQVFKLAHCDKKTHTLANTLDYKRKRCTFCELIIKKLIRQSGGCNFYDMWVSKMDKTTNNGYQHHVSSFLYNTIMEQKISS